MGGLTVGEALALSCAAFPAVDEFAGEKIIEGLWPFTSSVTVYSRLLPALPQPTTFPAALWVVLCIHQSAGQGERTIVSALLLALRPRYPMLESYG